jgi:hypothetical protein
VREAPIHVDLAGSQTRRPLFTVRVGMRSREMVDERRQIPADLLPMTAPPVKHGGHALAVDPSRCATPRRNPRIEPCVALGVDYSCKVPTF